MVFNAGSGTREWPSRDALCYWLALVIGALAWVLPARLSGHVEAWDGSLEWLWLAGTAVAAFVLSYIEPWKWWRWPLALVGAQFLAIFVQNPMLGPLACVGLGFLLSVGLLGMVPGFLGAALRSWQRRAQR